MRAVFIFTFNCLQIFIHWIQTALPIIKDGFKDESLSEGVKWWALLETFSKVQSFLNVSAWQIYKLTAGVIKHNALVLFEREYIPQSLAERMVALYDFRQIQEGFLGGSIHQ